MRAHDFLELAKKLVEGDEPAEIRTSLGRAYYAVFNLALECQRSLGFPFHSGRDSGKNHSLIRDRFGHVVTDDVMDLYKDMKDLHDMRKCADYDLTDPEAEESENAKAHVLLAEQTMESIEKIMFGSDKLAIIQEMQDWDNRHPDRLPGK